MSRKTLERLIDSRPRTQVEKIDGRPDSSLPGGDPSQDLITQVERLTPHLSEVYIMFRTNLTATERSIPENLSPMHIKLPLPAPAFEPGNFDQFLPVYLRDILPPAGFVEVG